MCNLPKAASKPYLSSVSRSKRSVFSKLHVTSFPRLHLFENDFPATETGRSYDAPARKRSSIKSRESSNSAEKENGLRTCRLVVSKALWGLHMLARFSCYHTKSEPPKHQPEISNHLLEIRSGMHRFLATQHDQRQQYRHNTIMPLPRKAKWRERTTRPSVTHRRSIRG